MNTETEVRRPTRRRRPTLPSALRDLRGWCGIGMVLLTAAVAFIGPFLSPHAIDDPVGVPGSPPTGGALLGTDALGRDVFSRVLHGGSEMLLIALVSVVLSYLVGMAVGMVAGFSKTWVDPALMRSVDLFLSVPSLLVLLVLITGAGASSWVLVLGTIIVSFPGIARLVRTATIEASTAGYVESAVARGEGSLAVMRREILPNIAPALVADAGVRFIAVIYLVASLGFLGFGAHPPEANWGLMVAENRQVVATNVFAVLAPAAMIAVLTIGVNLVGDAYVASGRRRHD